MSKKDFTKDVFKILGEMLTALTEKEFAVINNRYGLQNRQIMTLAAIGEQFNITRERVRQIQDNALKKLRRQFEQSDLDDFKNLVLNSLKKSGLILSENDMRELLLQNFPQNLNQINELLLLAEIVPSVVFQHNKVEYLPHFRIDSLSFKEIVALCNKAEKFLKESKAIVNLSTLFEYVTGMSAGNSVISFEASLKLYRKLVCDGRGVSLREWKFVNPKTLYDKILFVLNEIKEPLHFSEISKKIEAHGFDFKKVSVQAVHNELINNSIFVLIGRGIYALKDWGYNEGTVSDVIESVLSKSGPMHLYDLTQEVLQRRKVKPVTIQINLNSKKSKFRKNRDGLYELAN